MRLPSDSDPELTDLVRRYVVPGENGEPRYRELTAARFATREPPRRTAFLRSLAQDAAQVTDHELAVLLDSEWRARTTAAWLIGLERREQFREQLGQLLLASELTFAGRGYCVALAQLGSHRDAEILVDYLDRYLPRPECQFDQSWAIGALLHLDHRLGEGFSGRFLQPGGLWDRWNLNRFDADADGRHVSELCALLEEARLLP